MKSSLRESLNLLMFIQFLIDVSALTKYDSVVASRQKVAEDVKSWKRQAGKYRQLFGAISEYLRENNRKTVSPPEKKATQDLINSQSDKLGIPRDEAYKTLAIVLISGEDPADYMAKNLFASIQKLERYEGHLDSIVETDDEEELIRICEIFDSKTLDL